MSRETPNTGKQKVKKKKKSTEELQDNYTQETYTVGIPDTKKERKEYNI